MKVTRLVVVVYLGILKISLTCYSIITRKKSIYQISKNLFQPALASFLAYILISIPNFLDGNFELTNSNKSIFENKEITWTKWVYQSQLIGNNSIRFGFFANMIDWEEALKYKLINGN